LYKKYGFVLETTVNMQVFVFFCTFFIFPHDTFVVTGCAVMPVNCIIIIYFNIFLQN